MAGRAALGRAAIGSRGIAAVEFAICVPMLLLLLFGTLEIVMLYRTSQKLNTLTGNFAQMVANQEVAEVSPAGITAAHSPVPSVTSGAHPPGLSDLCAGAVEGLQPLPPQGLTIDVASVTETAAARPAQSGTAAQPASYDEWEVDMDSSCTPTGGQAIGLYGSSGALTRALGNGGSTALLQAQGDNVIIVRATLQYPGLAGLLIASAPLLTETAIARWRYAAAGNVTNAAATPPPAATLEFSCTGAGCERNDGA